MLHNINHILNIYEFFMIRNDFEGTCSRSTGYLSNTLATEQLDKDRNKNWSKANQRCYCQKIKPVNWHLGSSSAKLVPWVARFSGSCAWSDRKNKPERTMFDITSNTVMSDASSMKYENFSTLTDHLWDWRHFLTQHMSDFWPSMVQNRSCNGTIEPLYRFH